MKYSSIIFVVLFTMIAAAAALAPHAALAADTGVNIAAEELKKELVDFQKEVALLRDAAVGGKPVPPESLQRFRDRVLALRARVSDLKKKIPGSAARAQARTASLVAPVPRPRSAAARARDRPASPRRADRTRRWPDGRTARSRTPPAARPGCLAAARAGRAGRRWPGRS